MMFDWSLICNVAVGYILGRFFLSAVALVVGLIVGLLGEWS